MQSKTDTFLESTHYCGLLALPSVHHWYVNVIRTCSHYFVISCLGSQALEGATQYAVAALGAASSALRRLGCQQLGHTLQVMAGQCMMF